MLSVVTTAHKVLDRVADDGTGTLRGLFSRSIRFPLRVERNKAFPYPMVRNTKRATSRLPVSCSSTISRRYSGKMHNIIADILEIMATRATFPPFDGEITAALQKIFPRHTRALRASHRCAFPQSRPNDPPLIPLPRVFCPVAVPATQDVSGGATKKQMQRHLTLVSRLCLSVPSFLQGWPYPWKSKPASSLRDAGF